MATGGVKALRETIVRRQDTETTDRKQAMSTLQWLNQDTFWPCMVKLSKSRRALPDP